MTLKQELKQYENCIEFVNKQMIEILEHIKTLEKRYQGFKDTLAELHRSKEKIESELKNGK